MLVKRRARKEISKGKEKIKPLISKLNGQTSEEKEISRSKYSIHDMEEEEDMGMNHDEEERGDIEKGKSEALWKKCCICRRERDECQRSKSSTLPIFRHKHLLVWRW